MQAVVLDSYGGPDVLKLRDIPPPEPGPEEVVVDVHSTALNRADVSQRMGNYPGPPMRYEIPGLEIAGSVRQIGERVSGWAVGDAVMGIVGGGGYAEQVAVHERQLMSVPPQIGTVDAGAIPEVWITAWDALVLQGGLTSGRTALVHAGGSGVGTAAIQLVKGLGGRVVVTCSAAKVGACIALGADRAVDYGTEDFVQVALDETDGAGVDVVLDVVGGSYLARNLAALRVGGRIVQVGALGDVGETVIPMRTLSAKRATLIGTRLRARPLEEKLAVTQRFAREVLPLFSRQERPFVPVIDRRYPLTEIKLAHEYMETNRSFGKIMIDVAGGSRTTRGGM